MSLKSTNNRYGSVIITIHWLSALIIIGLIVSGFRMAGIDDLIVKASVLKIHASMGVLILLLTIIRMIWWCVDKKPAPVAGATKAQNVLSKLVHLLFYAFILVMAGSGMATMVLSGAGEIIFAGAVGVLPDFSTYPSFLVHKTAAVVMLILISLHFLGAMYHQLIKRDRLLARMGIGGIGHPK